MHRQDNSKFLLYIEPMAEQKSQEPINDEITKIVESLFNKAKSGTANYSSIGEEEIFTQDNGWRGCHTIDCGKRSDNHDYLLGNGMITNNQCVFYLQYYREAISENEMNKVMELCGWANKQKD